MFSFLPDEFFYRPLISIGDELAHFSEEQDGILLEPDGYLKSFFIGGSLPEHILARFIIGENVLFSQGFHIRLIG